MSSFAEPSDLQLAEAVLDATMSVGPGVMIGSVASLLVGTPLAIALCISSTLAMQNMDKIVHETKTILNKYYSTPTRRVMTMRSVDDDYVLLF